MQPDFAIGDRVEKVGGSYTAVGTIVAAFKTRAGQLRYVFEFDVPRGMLHIFNGDQMRHYIANNTYLRDSVGDRGQGPNYGGFPE